MIYLDTHVAAWLYASGAAALSTRAADAVSGPNDVRISPMVRLELQYLFEIGSVGEPTAVVVDALTATLGLAHCGAPFAGIVHAASHTAGPATRPID